MFGGYSIPIDERLFRWLAEQIRSIEQGSIQLDIEGGQLRSIGCHGHRYFRSVEELKEPKS